MDTPTPQTPDHDERPEPAPAPVLSIVEPLIGLASFTQMAGIPPHLVAALTRWMQELRHDPHKYYTEPTWQAFYTAMSHHPLP
jgi:hypothetical protein